MGFGYYEEESAIGKIYDRRLLTRLWLYIGPFWVQVVFAAALMIVVATLELVPQLILRRAIDHQVVVGRTDELARLTLLFFGTLGSIFVMRYAQAMLMAYVGQKAMMSLRLDLFSHLQRMSVSFFDRNPVGRLVTRLTNDVQMLDQVLAQGVVQMLTNLLMVSAIVVVLLVLDWRLALAMYVLLPALIFAVRRFAISQREGFRDQRVWLARINAYLNELITGVAVIQLFNRQPESMRRFDHRNQGVLDANIRVLFWYAVFEPTVVLFGAVTTGAILWYGGGRAIDGTLTLGTLVAFIGYMNRFYWPIRELSERYTTLQSAMASAERIFGVLDEREEVADVDDPVELSQIEGRIEFRNVWFAYHDENWVLRDVSFTITPGGKVAIVGATGAGKSTTMALLNRFYDVQRGEILVDGVPIRQYRQRDLRRHVGLMLQDAFVYTDTIEENIRLRDPSISSAQVRRAAAAVGASAFIERTPDGFATMLAERGANLSTGQKQLLALARVAAFDPEIVLIMDEATASIDPETEAIIQRGIQAVTAGRTTIVIAHRLNTIRAVDRILVLHHGELVEEGTHSELVTRDGFYARLYELQYEAQDTVG
ncbi:MAG: ABC transporter ATP-binding protein [Chloroflexi bacterium]|nr:ABC transporter ATP-binding protein [Chloroflexota bacterium]MDA1003714.1 ABC transporter ATP-binding protein [Chloroflexota bacterium]